MRSRVGIEGIVAAVHTPFRADGQLAPEVVPMQAAFMAANGVQSVFVSGTTGECHSLTCTERLRLLEEWAVAGRANDLTVIAHVGSNAIDDARALARKAGELGLAGISAMAPFYFRPATVEALVDWCAAIAAEAGAVPFYYYDIPSMTGVALPVDEFLRRGERRIPSLAGAKFTNRDLVAYRRCLDVGDGRFDLPWGSDEALLGALATGARGAVGSTYNWAGRLFADLMEAFARGDLVEARRLQSISIAMVDVLSSVGYMGASKALMGRLGVPVGPARAPIDNPSDDQMDAVIDQLHALGFAAWGARRTGFV